MKILITGGTGLIGTAITKELLQRGHEVRYYSRHPKRNDLNIPEYGWDPAGASWTKKDCKG
ncbi:MAG: NAD-dependent epimerase/dehydratase family protein [Owenweeksia sp.]|nr:NAD-dependent epimerase/dehydratase family protein [Owenweeksia sp.]